MPLPDPTLAGDTGLLVYLFFHRFTSGKTRGDPASLIVAADAADAPATAVEAGTPKTAAPTEISPFERQDEFLSDTRVRSGSAGSEGAERGGSGRPRLK